VTSDRERIGPMEHSDWLTDAFEENREHLRAVAYRLLGSSADAEDAVQDTWLRLAGADTADVANLRAWLTTVVARISLNMLRSRRHRAEEPVGDAWPPAAEARAGAARDGLGSNARPAPDPEDEVVLADSVGVALLVVLDALSPSERLAFVLHDLFAMPFTEVAAVLGRSEEATRQLASRARRRVRGAPGAPGASNSDHAASLARQREVTTAFLTASRTGNFEALLEVLDADVVLTGDAFVSPAGRPEVLRGREMVGRGAVTASERARHSQLALIDDQVGIVYAPGGRLELVLLMTATERHTVATIDIIADPARLRQLRIAVLPDE
jgi:RNA polymerase sigma factor (sigma-70 family)